jgi:hypothetical protein
VRACRVKFRGDGLDGVEGLEVGQWVMRKAYCNLKNIWEYSILRRKSDGIGRAGSFSAAG